jgi:hypothetical protein
MLSGAYGHNCRETGAVPREIIAYIPYNSIPAAEPRRGGPLAYTNRKDLPHRRLLLGDPLAVEMPNSHPRALAL